MQHPTLSDIYAARSRVYRSVRPTPLVRYPLLTNETGLDIYVKHENHNPTGAFKVRGGLKQTAMPNGLTVYSIGADLELHVQVGIGLAGRICRRAVEEPFAGDRAAEPRAHIVHGPLEHLAGAGGFLRGAGKGDPLDRTVGYTPLDLYHRCMIHPFCLFDRQVK
jgi:hypothetical protein